MPGESSSSNIDWEAVWRSLDWGDEWHERLAAQTLIRRAEKYARPLESDEATAQDTLTALLFIRGQERYAIPVVHVARALTGTHITSLPCVPAHYQGVINLRGRILSVLDLRRFWNLPADDPPGPPKLIVISAARLEIALLADDVLGIVGIPRQEIAPPLTAGVSLAHIQGVSPNGVVIVDVESLFADPRLTVSR